MPALKRQIEKPRPNSRKAEPQKRPRVPVFATKRPKPYILPSDNRFAEFTEEVREWLIEQDYNE